MGQEFDLCVVGEINVDLVLTGDVTPVFGQAERLVDDAALTIGSSGAIFACAAARLGLKVAYAGLVGDDLFGRFMLEGLAARGIDVSGVIVDPSTKTGLSVILSRRGDRAILTHLGAISRLRAETVDRRLLLRARHLHVTSYFLQDALRPGLPALLADAQAGGLTVSLDTNWDPSERWDDGLSAVLAHTDLFLPNEQEALAIAGRTDLAAALDALALRTPMTAVKRGAAGAVMRAGGVTEADPGFVVDVVDTTGAGDTFDAGFIHGYLHGWPHTRSLALACACGALSTRAAGGVDAQPTLAEAEGLIAARSPI